MAGSDSTAARVLEALRIERDRYTQALLAPLTEAGYHHDWRAFTAFTARVGLQSLPASAETVGLFVTARLADGRKPSTVTRQVAAIARIHREHGFPGPSTDQARAILRGARRLHPQAEEQMKPLTLADVRAIGMELARQDTPIALRDRAIVLVGFASALRSANLVALLLEDVEFVEEGVRLTIRKEKQDQEGKLRRWVGIPHGRHPENCPVAARVWFAFNESGIRHGGGVGRSFRPVDRDPDRAPRYAGPAEVLPAPGRFPVQRLRPARFVSLRHLALACASSDLGPAWAQ